MGVATAWVSTDDPTIGMAVTVKGLAMTTRAEGLAVGAHGDGGTIAGIGGAVGDKIGGMDSLSA